MAEGKAKRKYLIFTMEEGKRLPRIPMRSWTFVVVVGVVLAVMAMIDRGGLGAGPLVPTAPVTTVENTCSVVVTSSTLDVRAEPTATAAQVEQLNHGVHMAATTVLTGGFRKLSDGHWALDQFLTPVPGAACG